MLLRKHIQGQIFYVTKPLLGVGYILQKCSHSCDHGNESAAVIVMPNINRKHEIFLEMTQNIFTPLHHKKYPFTTRMM